MSEIIGRNGKGNKSTKVGSKHLYSNKDLEQALKVMKSLGFKVTPPSTEEEVLKQETSMKKLGFSESVRKVTEVEHNPKVLRARLRHNHVIAGVSYGSLIEIPIEQEALFRSLIHQDQLTEEGFRDTTDYAPRSKAFMIDLRKRKIEVNENAFNAAELNFEPAVTAGALDIAGFNPTVYNENRVF